MSYDEILDTAWDDEVFIYVWLCNRKEILIIFRKIIYYSTFLFFVWGAVVMVVTSEVPSLDPEGLKVSQTAAIFSALVVLFGAYYLYIHTEAPKEKSKNETIAKPLTSIDKIPHDDKEWIEEIKLRKKRGDKIIAYSSNGSVAARRKARALGIEECFVEFLSEEEIKERRGW